MKNDVNSLKMRLKELDQKIKAIEKQLPAHSVKPPIMTQLFELEDAGEQIQSGDGDDPFQGLITVKKLVTMLGGRIWVEHKKGLGNTFIVLLPIIEERIPA